MILFPFADYWWFYVGFTLFVLFLLALDLGVFHKKAHEVSIKESSIWTAIWISLALLFNYGFYLYAHWQFTTNENYLSIVGFEPAAQAKTIALEFLTGVVIFFGLLLVATGIKMFFAGTEQKGLEKNIIVRGLKKVFRIHPKIEGQTFFHRVNGLIHVTPLFLALLFLEMTDIIFAVDSVPAIFAITKEPLIVFTSNIFAMLGLRSMYFMLAGVMDRFVYIKYGLAAVLVFVGSKMVYLNEAFGGKFPIVWSLGIIAFLIGASICLSILKVSNRKGRFFKSSLQHQKPSEGGIL